MTSDMLRKLLVAGAAVAALSVAACGKPAEKPKTPPRPPTPPPLRRPTPRDR
jgi:predicted outer membrane protein